MSDIQDDDFGKELAAAFEADEGTVPEAAQVEEPAAPPAPKVEEPKKDDPANPADQNKEDEEPVTPPADPAQPPEETPPAVQAPETPPEAQPLTEEGIRRIMGDMRNEERNSSQELSQTTQGVMESYYPEGLSNVLVDQSTGKELRTPQDVVDASGGDMSMEQAAQWLMNEQYKLDQNIDGIKKQAEQIAETTVNFRRDAVRALEKYQPLFTAYPQLQQKAYNLMMRQVKADEQKGVILQAPDVLELYDDYLEPYQRAYEFATQQPATNPAAPVTPPPATPGINDRLDEGGDGGANTVVDDPNDFAQQVNKELAKGI